MKSEKSATAVFADHFYCRQQDIGNEEAEGKDLGWRQTSLKQQLRKDEGAAPDGHNDKGDEVVNQRITS